MRMRRQSMHMRMRCSGVRVESVAEKTRPVHPKPEKSHTAQWRSASERSAGSDSSSRIPAVHVAAVGPPPPPPPPPPPLPPPLLPPPPPLASPASPPLSANLGGSAAASLGGAGGERSGFGSSARFSSAMREGDEDEDLR